MKEIEKNRRKATSHDVARLAGVSQSTVSLVFSGKSEGRVTPERRRSVLDAAEKLRYRPNSSARGLKLGTQKLLALGVPNVSNPYFASVLKEVVKAAAEEGYATVLINTGEYNETPESILFSLEEHAFDGMIFWESTWSSKAQQILPASVVIVDGDSMAGADVFVSSKGIVETMISHLISLGHTRIGRVGFDLASTPFRVRSRAYRDCLRENGLHFNPLWELELPFGSTSSAAIESLLLQVDRPSAFICDDDLLAPLVYRAATRSGLVVGQSLSVVGIGDIELASLLEPPLSTVAIPAQVLGKAAVDAFLDKRAGRERTTRKVETPLIRRNSSGVAR